jgi:hypothetical protein
MLAAHDLGPGAPAGLGQQRRDVGVARHRHPGVAPDQVQHAFAGPGALAAARQRGAEVGRQRRGAFVDAGLVGKRGPQLLEQHQVVLRPPRMRDDDVRYEGAQRLGRVQPVLVHVDDDMRRRQRAQLGQVHVLGAAHLGHASDRRGWVDAETGARDQAGRQPQRHQRLGRARHQRGDARGRHCGSVSAR